MKITHGIAWRSLLIAFLLFGAGSAQAQYLYTVTNGEVTITGYTGHEKTITLPQTLEGLPVIGLGREAFRAAGAGVTNLTIPTGVKKIGYYAFYSISLEYVYISETVTSIEEGAFGQCQRLMAIDVDDNNLNYSSKNGILFDKSGSTLMRYPSAIKGNYVVPVGVKTISKECFGYGSGISGIEIVEGVETIEDSAFISCFGLTNVVLPSSIRKMSSGSFRNCIELKSFSVAESNLFFSSQNGVLFDKQAALLVRYPTAHAGESYSIPMGVTGIASSAFSTCPFLKKMYFPDSVMEVGQFAFADCTNLAGLYFEGPPPTVIEHYGPPNVFGGSAHVVCYYLPGTAGWGSTYCQRPTALWLKPGATSAVQVLAEPERGGTVSGGGDYPWASTAVVSAVAAPGWEFSGWSTGGTNGAASVFVPATGITVYAYFSPVPFGLTVEASPLEAGSVTGGGQYEAGASVVLTAVAAPGWWFTGWSDGSAVNPRTIVMPAEAAGYTAQFGLSQPSLVHYAKAGNPYALAPYTNWATAAASIQDAVDAAEEGDTVLVAEGVYDQGIGENPFGPSRVAINKPITVRSSAGPAVTIIKGGRLPDGTGIRCVYLGDAMLAGFTLTEGVAEMGGGVFCDLGGVISNCVVTGNLSTGMGGGIFGVPLDFQSPETNSCVVDSVVSLNRARSGGGCFWVSVIRNSRVVQNVSEEGFGGGVEGFLEISGSEIISNTAPSGAGVFCPGYGNLSTSLIAYNRATNGNGGGALTLKTIDRCTFEGNEATECGGAAFAVCTESIRDCRFIGNRAGDKGGATYCQLGLTENCLFVSNRAVQGGAAWAPEAGYYRNCVFDGNEAVESGGAIFLPSLLEHCTFVRNRAGQRGGAVDTLGIFSLALENQELARPFSLAVNSVFYDNEAPFGADIQWAFPNEDWMPAAGFWNIFNCSFSSTASVSQVSVPVFPVGQGNIIGNPGLVPGSYRLAGSSPCVDAGDTGEVLDLWAQDDPDCPTNPLTLDYEGRPRVIDGNRDGAAVADMGANEFMAASLEKPDFVITSFTTDPEMLVPGGSFEARVTVRNEGPGSGNAGKLRLWLNHPANALPGEAGTANQDVGVLEPNQSQEFTFSGLTTTSGYGTFTLRAFVDADDEAVELSEGNNQASKSYTFVKPYAEKVDLVALSLTTVPAILTPGCTFKAKVKVKNTGKKAGTIGIVRLWLNHPLAAQAREAGNVQKRLGLLDSGAVTNLTFGGLVATNGTGTFTVRVFVDANNATVEASEGNNQNTLTYSFAPVYQEKPDFVVESVTTEPAVLVRGGAFTVKVVVKNTGLGAGEAGLVRLWLNHPANATPGEAGDASQATGPLEPGQSVERLFSGLVAPDANGTFTLRAYADADNATRETSEGNNQINRTYEFR
ncbi:MAG: leucine-rich repeat protein [Kiritimatiellia bacterium]